MNKNKISLATAITAALISSASQADSWNVTQTTTPASDTTMTQYGNSQGGSVQAMNAVSSTTATVAGSQENTTGAFELTLEQKESTNNSTQSVNYVNADTIGDSGSAMVQSYSGSGNTLLKQSEANLVNNHQAVNTASAAVISDLAQTTTAANLSLNQANTSASSQAANNAVASNVSELSQTVQSDSINSYQSNTTASTQATNNVTAEAASNVQQNAQTSFFSLGQSGGSNNTQAINNIVANTELTQANQNTYADHFYIDQHGEGNQVQAVNRIASGTSAVGAVNQSTNSSYTDMWQMGWSSQGSVQALNMVDGNGVNTASKQTVSGNYIHMHSDGGGIQAGNYLKSSGTGVVASADQDVNTQHLDINQSGYGSAAVQAANLMDIGGELTAGKQTINTNTLNLHQYSSDSGISAGNAVLTNGTGVGGTVTQTATAASLSMNQYSGNGSLQAVNYVGSSTQ